MKKKVGTTVELSKTPIVDELKRVLMFWDERNNCVLLWRKVFSVNEARKNGVI